MKILSQISSIIVALLFVYTINFKSIVTIQYFANQSEIIELFCINKENTELQCNGKCHLMSQLTEVENNTDNAPFSQNTLSYNLELNGSFFENEMKIQPNLNELESLNYILEKTTIQDGYSSLIYSPPKT